MSNNILLSTNDLCKKFKREQAVHNLSITVHKDTVYGLLGPNGAGKSTTLKMLVGLLKPTTGSISFAGAEWSRENLRDIGFLIEQPPIYGNLSAKENLKVHTALLNLPDSRINEVLELVDLLGTEKKRAVNFSTGMKQRLGIAIAILNKPKLLILDEPTNGLDPIGIQDLRKLIRSFPDMGMTVILSSHILTEVEHIADEIGIISHGMLGYEGKLQDTDNLEELFTRIVMQNEERAGETK